MTTRNIKHLLDAFYQAKRVRELMPALPKGVTPAFIHYLDTIAALQQQGVRVKVSDISDALHIPRPGVTRTVNDMVDGGYLVKSCLGRGRPRDLSDNSPKKAACSRRFLTARFLPSLRRC